MRSSVLICLCLAAVCAFTACRRSEEVKVNASAPPTFHKIELGKLVTREEVGQIQKTSITDLKQTEIVNVDFVTSQGYYNSNEPNCSVSIAIMQHNPEKPNGRTTEQFWKDSFANAGRAGDGEREEKRATTKRKTRSQSTVHRWCPWRELGRRPFGLPTRSAESFTHCRIT